MDPNQYNFQQSMFHLIQNQQNSNPQNSQFPPPPTNSTVFFSPPNNPNMYFRPPINTHGINFSHHEPETPNEFMSERQVPQFSTQVGVENITIDKEQRRPVKKKPREVFTREEDTLLMQSWLNVSKDPIVGVDQKVDSFWLRITDNYNQYRGQSREKLQGQLKSRWHRINGLVQKFVGCYKQAVHGKKSGASEKDILVNAHAFFEQDEGAPFNLEYAWRLLKDEPKWMGACTENSSKRIKNSTSGAYTASPNSETPSSYEFNSSSPMERPMGQKAAKRKGKAKENTNATEPPFSVISDTMNKRMDLMENLARLKEEENKLVKEKMEFEAMQFIMSDTSKMNDTQREFHEKRCNNLKEKYGW
ncbi:glutathione S-transferase T3-like [Vicia villosa]|uniref:glutathione S-transferase T3-like n=1 Tax=Vicia villosa TaxID=3911 RepID=UPI00273AD88D|nr:glutathione S-transferase T3-like [Vicia villosa]